MPSRKAAIVLVFDLTPVPSTTLKVSTIIKLNPWIPYTGSVCIVFFPLDPFFLFLWGGGPQEFEVNWKV